MPTSTPELQTPGVRSVTVTRSAVTFLLEDGRSVSAPLSWFPRLETGSPKERGRWELIGVGGGVHWPDLDEDISVESLLLGRRSMESERSFRAWLAARPTRRKPKNSET
jgi:hypothetical protein